MQVQNIECQLAQVQLKRYLNGEELPAELLTDLESHLEECRDCREAAKQRSVTAPDAAPKATTKFDLKALVAPRPTTANAPAPNLKNSKTIFLSAGLALVLIAMSTILRDPTKFLGAKADESVKAAATTETSEAQLGKPETGIADKGATDLSGLALSATGLQDEVPAAELDPKPEGPAAVLPDSEPTVENEPKGPAATPTTTGDGLSIPGKPTIQDQNVVVVGGSEPKPPASTAKPRTTQARRPVRRAPAKKSATNPASSGIRVYDSTGKRIK